MTISHTLTGGTGKVRHQPLCFGNGYGFGIGVYSGSSSIHGKGVGCGSGSGGGTKLDNYSEGAWYSGTDSPIFMPIELEIEDIHG